MKFKKREDLSWRRLDNYAKLFPLASTRKYSSVFRLSIVLKEKIKPEVLEKAVKFALRKFKFFKVRMRRGIFWYYFENNTKNVLIEEESDYPCKYIDLPANNDYLFKITYFDKKINLDMFHCLTDGNSALHFLKEITYNYIEIEHFQSKKIPDDIERKINYNTKDSYQAAYNKHLKADSKGKKAYVLKGKKLLPGVVAVTHEYIDMIKLKEIAKQNEATVTQYLTSVLIYAIYQEQKKEKKQNKLIKISVPVNLKKYFPSKTISNFFSYIDVNVDANKEKSFENILEAVKKEFKEKLKEEELLKTIATNVKLGNNGFLRMLPLFIKKKIVQFAYREIRKYNTTTFSNVGRVGFIAEYKPYIDKVLFLIAPESIEKIKCTACSVDNTVIFSVTSVIEERNVENTIKEFLNSKGIKVEIEGNGV